jgi:sugar lactone lactonase YvrE
VTGASAVYVWDSDDWSIVFADTAPNERRIYAAAALSPNGTRLATQSLPQGQEVVTRPTAVWDLESATLIAQMRAFVSDYRGALAFSPDGRLLVAADSGRPKIFEPYTGRELGRLEGPSAGARHVTFSPDGSRIATAEIDGSVRLWDGATGEAQLALRGHSSEVASVAFSPDGSRLVSVDVDGTLLVWALDVDDLVDIARSRVTRDLTDVECRLWVGQGCPPAPDVARLAPALAETEGPVGIEPEAWSAAPPAGGWERTAADVPAIDGTLVYDTGTGVLVGVDTMCTWVSESGVAPGDGCDPMPPPPEGEESGLRPTIGGAVYHPGLDRVIVLRTDDGATFTYDADDDAARWEELLPSGGPFAERYGQGLVYDAESQLIVSFGGAEWGRIDEGKHTGLADTWTYDAAANEWTNRTPPTSPPGRVDHGIAYDSRSDHVVVFGGATGLGGDVLGDTWAYDANTNIWTEMTPAVSPPGRAGAAMWYDPTADLVFLFGGSRDWSSWPYLPWDVFGGQELWAYDYDDNTWTLLRTDTNPGYRVYARAVFDERSGESVLIGGASYDDARHFIGNADDMWAYRYPATAP